MQLHMRRINRRRINALGGIAAASEPTYAWHMFERGVCGLKRQGVLREPNRTRGRVAGSASVAIVLMSWPTSRNGGEAPAARIPESLSGI